MVIKTVADGIRVEGIAANFGAQQAGLVEGDIIIAIDGQPIAGEALAATIERLTGDAGTTVKVTLRHADGTETTKDITRKAFPQDPTACERLGRAPSSN